MAAGGTLDWLVSNFTRAVPHVDHAALISTDGLPMAVSTPVPPERLTQLAAAGAAMAALAAGASGLFDGGRVLRSTVEMSGSYFLLMGVGDGSQLMALASAECDIGQVVYEMTLLVERVGSEVQALSRQ
ncbi:roadblock/LC7 domain-containing protein [Nocardia mikamii]|uniref:roadblock/LC7 domain-containing protein n=1 Tax=Nocardia mikamii TaxID=508464 RepID=UPI0007A3F690|nr:roadblock/LC7 domain-containing protein [Nocardia mikamii]